MLNIILLSQGHADFGVFCVPVVFTGSSPVAVCFGNPGPARLSPFPEAFLWQGLLFVCNASQREDTGRLRLAKQAGSSPYVWEHDACSRHCHCAALRLEPDRNGTQHAGIHARPESSPVHCTVRSQNQEDRKFLNRCCKGCFVIEEISVGAHGPCVQALSAIIASNTPTV